MAENETAPQAAEPTQVEVSTVAPVAPAVGAGPWQADIQASFNDPQVAATVDAFLRSKVQPRMTQLEQEVAGTENARRLWDAFQADPREAYASITAELYGEEAARAALEALQQRLETQPPAAPATTAQPVQPQLDPSTMLTPDEVAAWRQDRELAAYDAKIGEITSDPANADIDPNLIHTFVAAAEGNFEDAITRYRAFAADFLAKYGVTPGEAGSETAPPVVGNAAGAAAPSTTPVQPDYRAQGLSPQEALHKAIEDATAQTRANAQAPPIA